MTGFPVHLVDEGIDWPAWVQAIGSIAAIYMAGRVSVLQERLTHTRRVEAATGVAGEIVDLLGDAASAVRDGNGTTGRLRRFNVKRFADLEGMLAIIPLHELGSMQLVKSFTDLRYDLQDGAQAMRAAISADETQADPAPHWDRIYSVEQRAILHLLEVDGVLRSAQRAGKLWWLW